MLLEKTLILKGVAGVATVGGVVGGGYFLKKSLEKPLTKEEKLAEINKKLTTLGLDDCLFKENEIVNVNEFSRECELDKTKFEKIKFSNMGASPVTVTGWGTNNIKLKIAENNSNVIYTFKEVKTKLTISGDPTKPNITLKKDEEREFEDKGGKLGKVSKASYEEGEKTKSVNKKLSDLKIPDWCRFEEEDKDQNSIECDLSNKEDDLKKIDFANKDKGKDSRIEGSVEGLKLTINRLSELDAKLKHSPATDLEFIFGGTYSNEIKIMDNKASGGLSDIVLKPNTNPILIISTDTSDSKGKLIKPFVFNNFSSKLGLGCTSSVTPCKPLGGGKKIRIFTNGDNLEEIEVPSGQENTDIMDVADNTNGFEQGFKYTAKNSTFLITSSKLEANATYQAKYVTGKGWGLVKKT